VVAVPSKVGANEVLRTAVHFDRISKLVIWVWGKKGTETACYLHIPYLPTREISPERTLEYKAF
jgi:hypothetical protein